MNQPNVAAPVETPAPAANTVAGTEGFALPVNGSPMIPPATNAAPAPEAKPKTIFVGGRAFATQEEALAWADQVSRQAPPPAAPVAATPKNEEVDPGDLIFEDPKAALRMSEDRLMAKIDRAYAAKEAEKEVWNNFYRSNSDLSGFRDMVDFVKTKHWEEIKSIPLDQALEKIAKEARGMMSRARGVSDNKQELSSGAVITAVPGNSPAPNVQNPVPKKMTFIDEMKELRNRRKKVV